MRIPTQNNIEVFFCQFFAFLFFLKINFSTTSLWLKRRCKVFHSWLIVINRFFIHQQEPNALRSNWVDVISVTREKMEIYFSSAMLLSYFRAFLILFLLSPLIKCTFFMALRHETNTTNVRHCADSSETCCEPSRIKFQNDGW